MNELISKPGTILDGKEAQSSSGTLGDVNFFESVETSFGNEDLRLSLIEQEQELMILRGESQVRISQLEEDLKTRESAIASLSLNLSNAEVELKRLRTTISEISDQRAQLRIKNKQIHEARVELQKERSLLDQKQGELQEKRTELNSQLERAKEIAIGQSQKLQNQQRVQYDLSSKLTALAEERKFLRLRIDELQTTIDKVGQELREKNNELRNTNERYQRNLNDLSTEKVLSERQLTEMRERELNFLEQLESKQKENAELKLCLEQATKADHQGQLERQAFASTIEKVKTDSVSQISDLAATAWVFENDLLAQRKDNAHLREALTRVQDQLATSALERDSLVRTAKEQNQQASLRENALKGKINDLRQRLARADFKISELNLKIRELEDRETQSQALQEMEREEHKKLRQQHERDREQHSKDLALHEQERALHKKVCEQHESDREQHAILSTQHKSLLRQHEALLQDNEELKGTLENQTQALEQHKMQNTELRIELAGKMDRIQFFEELIAKLRENQAHNDEQFAHQQKILSERNGELSQGLDRAQFELTLIQARLDRVMQESEVERANLTQQLEALQVRVEQREDNIRVSENRAALAERELQEIRNQLQSVLSEQTRAQERFEEQLASLSRAREQVLAELNQASERHDNLQSEKSKLETQLANLTLKLNANAELEPKLRLQMEQKLEVAQRRESQVNNFAKLFSHQRESVMRTARELVKEMHAVKALNPLKEYLSVTEFEIERAEQQLRRTPTSSMDRARVEACLNQLCEQRTFLRQALSNSDRNLSERLTNVERMLSQEQLPATPPLPPLAPQNEL